MRSRFVERIGVNALAVGEYEDKEMVSVRRSWTERVSLNRTSKLPKLLARCNGTVSGTVGDQVKSRRRKDEREG